MTGTPWFSYNECMAVTTVGSAPDKRERSEGMGGLAKGLAIIEAFTPQRPQLTLSDAARLTGTSPAAARRCLLTLEELGYLVRDNKTFRPTPRLMRLGSAYLTTASLPELAQPRLEAVRDELGESVSLAVLDGDDASFVARAEGPRLVTTGVRLGSRLPAHASATGRVLLGALSDDELNVHLRSATPVRTTENTLLTVSEIRDRVIRARTDGYAYTDEELELGMRTMAVPVLDRSGNTCGAMSISAFAARMTLDEMRDRFIPVLQSEAARLGQML